MKISTELRHIINSRFPVYSGSRVSEKEIPGLLVKAAKVKPEITKALASILAAQKQIKAAGAVLRKFGVTVYSDGDYNLTDLSKLEKIVSIPQAPPTRNEVLQKLAALTPNEGIAFLASLGIDWS